MAASLLSAVWERPSISHRLPLPDSFLNLRAIPQISFDEARAAFPMVSPDCPPEWKEQLRQLRNQLNQAQSDDERLQVLAFCSMNGRRLRFGTAANLALAMASIQDTRVLIIDANLSAPTLHSALNAPISPGLCDATRADRLALPACFRRITGTQVYLLTVGDLTAFPTAPLDLAGFHALLRSLRSQFDWIFLDTPGFDTPTDALALTMAADGVIMLIESEHDSYRDVARALGQVEGRRLLGAVMY